MVLKKTSITVGKAQKQMAGAGNWPTTLPSKSRKNESELEVRQGSKLSKPASINVLLPAHLHFPTGPPSPPNSATSSGPRVQIHRPMETVFI